MANDYGDSGDPQGFDVAAELRAHMEETRTVDIVKTTVIVLILAVVVGWWVGMERTYIMGVRTFTGEWRPLWGAVGAIVPIIGGPVLYRWLRSRRARRYYSG